MDAQVIVNLVKFIAGIAALIVLHEFGHYIAARLCKVEVEEFGLGFPPRALKLFTFKGTDFTLNWIPLGGFVRPKGENDPDVPGGLAASSPWVRLTVLFAGPVMNLIIGVALGVWVFYSLGEPVLNKVLIQGVAPGSPAEAAGLQKGDLILSVNERVIDSNEALQSTIAANLGREVSLTYARGGQTLTARLTPRASPPPNQGAIGILMGHPTQPTTLWNAVTRGAAATYDNARSIVALPVKLAQGQASPNESRLVGYKGMFDIFVTLDDPLIFFMAISISLGVINLFPIPALDGGRILLTLPEILFRRRIPAQYENYIHLAGFALLIVLMIYINVMDFVNPIQLPPR
jgi:regulator of sigma E protease